MRSMFGWSYPPGAASDPLAPYNQTDCDCEMCGVDADSCTCPECGVCGAYGDPECTNPDNPDHHFTLVS